ncbi:MAG: FIST N-terminal domain-containing protein [Myxococcota bacterium]
MLRAGVGISVDRDGKRAIEAAAADALVQCRGQHVDLALLFATPAYPDSPDSLLDVASSALGTKSIVGASAHGVLAGGSECEGGASVAVMALCGIDVLPFCVPDLRGDEASAGTEIASRLGGGPRAEDLVIVLPDPHLDTAALVAGMRSSLGSARVIGAGSADPLSDTAAQWCDNKIETGAVVGAVLRGNTPARVGVTQACRPVSELMTVTRAQGNWILELDGRPALDAYRSAALGPLADDLARASAFVLVGLPREPSETLRPGSYLVRHVVGFSTENHAFAVPELLARGDQVAFMLREPDAARRDLKEMLSGLEGGSPGLGLYFNCCARGAGFFGVAGLEAAYLESTFGSLPIVGMFGSCEIGPIGSPHSGTTELLTYTGVLALLDT